MLLAGIWVLATPGVYVWAVWAIGEMEIAVPFIAWDAYGTKRGISETAIDAELKKMSGNS